jgi:2-polyprenyl-6-methoxyphenol hydroxylase-like FAD-dependent oxidoreductase
MSSAVHRHPPANGLGSNTCIQDAFNLAWKIAYVLKGALKFSFLALLKQFADMQPKVWPNLNCWIRMRKNGSLLDAILTHLLTTTRHISDQLEVFVEWCCCPTNSEEKSGGMP